MSLPGIPDAVLTFSGKNIESFLNNTVEKYDPRFGTEGRWTEENTRPRSRSHRRKCRSRWCYCQMAWRLSAKFRHRRHHRPHRSRRVPAVLSRKESKSHHMSIGISFRGWSFSCPYLWMASSNTVSCEILNSRLSKMRCQFFTSNRRTADHALEPPVPLARTRHHMVSVGSVFVLN